MVRRRVLSLLLLIGIVGYFSVPSVAGYIIHAGAPGALLHKTTRVFDAASTAAGRMAIPNTPLLTPTQGSSTKN